MNNQLRISRLVSCVLVSIMVFGVLGISGERVFADASSNSSLSCSSTDGTSQEMDVALLSEDNMTETAIPAVPTGFTVTSAGCTSIKLIWTAVPGATGYAIFRSPSASTGFVKLTTRSTTSYTNTGLTTGTKYYYKVKAYITVGTKTTFGVATVGVGAIPKPATPIGLKALQASPTGIKLTWTPVTGATGYVIYRSKSPTSGFVSISTGTSASYTNTGLTTGTKYYYQVKAYTTVGTTKVYSVITKAVSGTLIPSTIGTGARLTPYSGYQNRALIFQRYSSSVPKTINVQLLEVIKGAEANAIVHSENQYNKVPAVDEEWILMKFHMKYVSGPEELLYASDILSSYSGFYSATYNVVNTISTASFSRNLSGLGQYSVKMYPGGESDVWYGMLVKKTVGYPLYRIATGYDKAKYTTIYTWLTSNPKY